MSELLVYNIRKERYAHSLRASGSANRWNKTDEYIIYAGSSRALAILELTAHRAFIRIDESYRLMVIELKISEKDIQTIEVNNLPENWKSVEVCGILQSIGSKWYRTMQTLILKVPSLLIPKEYNFLINTQHPDFKKKVEIMEIELFEWDKRLI